MPARIRLSHARNSPTEADSFSVLGEVAIAAGRAGKLAHSLNLGPQRRVDRYLRLEFSGHLQPRQNARSPGALPALDVVLLQSV